MRRECRRPHRSVRGPLAPRAARQDKDAMRNTARRPSNRLNLLRSQPGFKIENMRPKYLRNCTEPSARGLGFVDLDFECSTVRPILLGLMGIWQKGLSSWTRWWNTQIGVNSTPVHEQMGRHHGAVL